MGFPSLVLSAGNTTLEIVPARGAIVTRFALGQREVLYLDRETLDDPTKNVRGGIPVLLPFAGKLADDRFLPAGTTMKQHGFGRNLAWTLRDAGKSHVALELTPSDATRAQFPYEFVFAYTVTVEPRALTLALAVTNRGDSPLPMAPGWHPYFNCPAKRKSELSTDLAGFDPSLPTDAREFDFGVAAPAGGRVHFDVPEVGAVNFTLSANLRHLQFWSQPGKPFECLEPFLGPAGIINTDGRDEVAPGATHHYAVKITIG